MTFPLTDLSRYEVTELANGVRIVSHPVTPEWEARFEARARFYYLFTYEAEGVSRLGWGHYDDRYVRADGDWLISSKRIHTLGVVYLDKGWAGLPEIQRSAADWENANRVEGQI